MVSIFRVLAVIFIAVIAFNGCATVPPKPNVMPQEGVYHIVGSGQTLYRISKAYGADLKELMRVNSIADPTELGIGERLFIPGAQCQITVEPYKAEACEPVEKVVGKKQYLVKWKTITLHHSATPEGNAEAFDRNHRRRKMGGLFYHFVIGNGRGCGDGEIEVGWRWRRQAEVNRPKDIQICLVGNFNRQELTSAEFKSLVELLKVLTRKYSIPTRNIRIHKDVDDKFTECPGENFPFKKIMAALKKDA